MDAKETAQQVLRDVSELGVNCMRNLQELYRSCADRINFPISKVGPVDAAFDFIFEWGGNRLVPYLFDYGESYEFMGLKDELSKSNILANKREIKEKTLELVRTHIPS